MCVSNLSCSNSIVVVRVPCLIVVCVYYVDSRKKVHLHHSQYYDPFLGCRSESLQLSAASCLGVITETLPKFLSSFINDIITTVIFNM